MAALIFATVVLVVALVWTARRLRVRAARRRVATAPGSSLERAIAVRSFDEIDRAVAGRRCACGARLRPTGEGARDTGARRYRFARVACDDCEEEHVVFFDVTDVLH